MCQRKRMSVSMCQRKSEKENECVYVSERDREKDRMRRKECRSVFSNLIVTFFVQIFRDDETSVTAAAAINSDSTAKVVVTLHRQP